MSYYVLHLTSVDSTNKYLLEHADSLPDFTFLDADYQTAGKGRGERRWESKAGENLLCSLLVKERSVIGLGAFLSLVPAVTLSRMLEKEGIQDVMIKWPNDVYVGGKKIAGILLQGDLPRCLVLGMGINLNQMDFVGDFRIAPTSVALEKGVMIPHDQFRARFYDSLANSLQNPAFSKNEFIAYYSSHDYLKGHRIELLGKQGLVLGVDEDFGLLVQTKEGILSLISGEAHLL